MKNISISNFINFIFFAAFLAVTISYSFFIKLDKESYESNQHKRYEQIANNFLTIFQGYPTDKELNKLYSKFDTFPIKDRNEKLQILNTAEELKIHRTVLGIYRVYEQEEIFYIYVQRYGYNIMLADLKATTYSYFKPSLIFIFSLVILLFLHVILKEKIHPLNELNEQINKFSKGDLTINTSSENSDEIGKIANNFNNAIIYINDLISSKNLFMRNMMHELKTPITKAMFAIETLDDGKNKEILQRAFLRMNDIIKELATIEKITSNTQAIYKEETSFNFIYHNAVKLLMVEHKEIENEITNFDLFVDINLFSIVIKNLLDNALKFSTENKAFIRANKDEITIISKGKKLKENLSYYTDAFTQEKKQSEGFGLGLYIVNTICQQHDYCLKYKYKDEHNIFKIVKA